MYSERQELINGYEIIMNIHHCAFYHDKRCLSAYLYDIEHQIIHRQHRLNKIREYRWDKGNTLSDDAESLLSKNEVKYFCGC